MGKKCGTFEERKNRFKNGMVKKAISSILALSIPITMAGCSSQDNDVYVEEDITYTDDADINYYASIDEYDSIISDENFFANRRCHFSNSEDEELCSNISNILNVKYDSSSGFSEGKMYADVQNEWNNLSDNRYYFPKTQTDEYSWLENGVINKTKLKNKLISNGQYVGSNYSSKELKLVDYFISELDNLINYVKEKNPNFDFSIFYKNLNNLNFSDIDDPELYGCYDYQTNSFMINMNDTGQGDVFKVITVHEMNHLISNQSYESSQYTFDGSAMDYAGSTENPFSMEFISECVCDQAGCDINNLNITDHNYHKIERHSINKICYATDCNMNDIMSCYYACDPNSFIDLFEPEMQNMKYVYGTFSGFNIYTNHCLCDYSDSFKKDCYNFSQVNLLKNYAIKNMKAYKNGEISSSEFEENMNNIYNKFDDNGNHTKEYYNCLNEIDEICKNYINVKSY